MSTWREQMAEIEEPRDVVAFLGSYYHVLSVVVLLGFMLWSRVRSWKRFLVDGTVYFSGNDAWYHYRMVSYTVKHWPETSPFDPFTHFPYGTHSSQFGTIFDQAVATVALVVGLGSPSEQTIRMVLLFAPAVIGTAVAIPVYFLAKRVGGRLAGVVAVGLLALVGSTFAARGTVGFADHQIAEAFLQSVAVLATMKAVSVAEDEKPIYELFLARDVSALRRPVGWAVVAGVATATYIWVWPPGVLLFGVLGLFYLFELSSEYAHGESPEHVAIAGAISMAVAAVLTLATLEQVDIAPTAFTLLQPGMALAVGFGCLFMAWLARQWDARGLSRYQYPVGVASILIVLAGAMALLLPDLFGFFVDQTMRVVGLSVSPTAGTVGEAQPMPIGRLFTYYRFAVFVAALGAIWIIAKQFLSKPRAEYMLLVVWGAIMLLATLTQARFDYYLAIPLVVLAGMLVGRFAKFANLAPSADDIELYQVITVVAVILVLFAPLALQGPNGLSRTATGVGPSTTSWGESLHWMEDNTPEVGQYGGANNSMAYYGTYEATEDYEYPAGAYGVMSWWDYGHWITVMGERIPNANPFQQGADAAANFLLSTSEEQALTVLNRLEDGNRSQTRYVMVDWKMVSTESRYTVRGQTYNLNGKYFAPFAFTSYNVTQTEYYWGGPDTYGLFYKTAKGASVPYRTFSLKKQPYYNSTAVRLYQYHGSAMNAQPIVVDWSMETIRGSTVRMSQGVKSFDNMTAARNYTANDPTSQIGGVGPWPQEDVPALEHFRLVQVSNTSALRSSQRYQIGLSKIARGALESRFSIQGKINPGVRRALHRTHPAWVKTFERVPGATVKGEAPANTTVTASVTMRVPGSNTTFEYRQHAQTGPDGTFTMTLPYSTTGYDKWGVKKGYTDVRVTATGPYEFSTPEMLNKNLTRLKYNATAHVTEGQVIGENDTAVTVSLTKTVLQKSGQVSVGNETTNSTASSTADGSESSEGNETSNSNSVLDPVSTGAEPKRAEG